MVINNVFNQYIKIHLYCFVISVIVTDKSNLLLRYLHNQWDKKVNDQ